jgi:hypothetical protein
MAANEQRQDTLARAEEKPYGCRISGCYKRFSRRQDADRHYYNIHDRGSFDANCPLCDKMISDIRKDNQKKHMRERHPSFNECLAWTRSITPKQLIPTDPIVYMSDPNSMLATTAAYLRPSASNGVFHEPPTAPSLVQPWRTMGNDASYRQPFAYGTSKHLLACNK